MPSGRFAGDSRKSPQIQGVRATRDFQRDAYRFCKSSLAVMVKLVSTHNQ